MEIVIAIELIAGAAFVVGFWYTNPELELSRQLSRLMEPYDDEEDEVARDR